MNFFRHWLYKFQCCHKLITIHYVPRQIMNCFLWQYGMTYRNMRYYKFKPIDGADTILLKFDLILNLQNSENGKPLKFRLMPKSIRLKIYCAVHVIRSMQLDSTSKFLIQYDFNNKKKILFL